MSTISARRRRSALLTFLSSAALWPIHAALPADSGNAFNPKISLILQGNYASYSNNSDPVIPGFLLADETEFKPEGFSLDETELAVESNIDDQFHGWAAISLDGEGAASVEEAYVNTLALPEGLVGKFGRFFSSIGYLNTVHGHAWDFADQPLIYRAMLGNQYSDDGAQLRWLVPLDLFMEIGGEVGRGRQYPGGGGSGSGIPAKNVFVHLGDDLGLSWSYQLGASYLMTKAEDRITGDGVGTAFTGNPKLLALDFVFKWAPDGNTVERNGKIQGEFFHRKESGDLVYDPDGAAIASPYDGKQYGFYLQGVYQFIPQWRVGLRYDWLAASNDVATAPAGTDLAVLADDGSHPKRYTAMVDWSHSEFSRFRLQFARDESRPGGNADNQVILQYIMAMGAHPAHAF